MCHQLRAQVSALLSKGIGFVLQEDKGAEKSAAAANHASMTGGPIRQRDSRPPLLNARHAHLSSPVLLERHFISGPR